MRVAILLTLGLGAILLFLLAGASANSPLFAQHYAWLLGANALVAGQHPFYAAFFVLQLLAYGLAAAGPALSRLRAVAPRLLAPYYFVLLNLACAAAFWKFLNGEKMVTWKPRGGS